jgi:DegV family protein with EDD domain
MAMVAAEAAAADRSREEIVHLLEQLVPLTRVMAMPDELDSAVRGGRVPAWVGKVARALRLTPVLTAKDGKMSAAGAHWGRGVNPEKFARRVLGALNDDESYWVMISHIGNEKGAQEMRRMILQGHPRIHSCHIAKAGPALGVHMGNRGLIVGFLPDPAALVHGNA